MEKPLVSIITPAFNSEKFIQESIQSVQNQTYQNWEMIIVDDASTDKTVSIVNLFASKDSRIKVYNLAKNSGAGIARDKGLSNALGKYICFLDADDLWKAEKLQKQINFLVANKLPFTFSFYNCIDEAGNSLNKRVEAPLNLSYRQLFFCNYVGNLTGIYDTDYFGKITISSIRKRQDWMLWLTILKKIKVAKPVPESLAFYRIRENSISTSKLDLIKYNFTVYRKFHGLNFVVSITSMALFLIVQLFIKPAYINKVRS